MREDSVDMSLNFIIGLSEGRRGRDVGRSISPNEKDAECYFSHEDGNVSAVDIAVHNVYAHTLTPRRNLSD